MGYTEQTELEAKLEHIHKNQNAIPDTPQQALDEMDELDKLMDQMEAFFKWYKLMDQKLNVRFYSGQDTSNHVWYQIVNKRKRFLYPHTGDPYYQPLVLEKTEEVNGYFLYDAGPLPLFNKQDFDDLVAMYNGTWKDESDEEEDSEEEWTDEYFRKVFLSEACSDWCKMDDHGDYFQGFWRCPEGSIEKENAYELTRLHNLDQLCLLPFPNRLKWETIRIGCGNRMESVRYTNFMCVWLERKMKQMNL